MISLTERYLAAALRSIPDAQRADVDRELRSSIADAWRTASPPSSTPSDAHTAPGPSR